METFAVIDTETNWENQVMSIGTVLADAQTFQPIEARYHILTPEYRVGGMYADVLMDRHLKPVICSRKEAMHTLSSWLWDQGVRSIFAYNACFDRRLLPELGRFSWYDIMHMAAYRQHNPKLPRTADFCSTGRLKRGFGVEPMLQLLSGDPDYRETHNAFYDALDELEIMRLLGRPLREYIRL